MGGLGNKKFAFYFRIVLIIFIFVLGDCYVFAGDLNGGDDTYAIRCDSRRSGGFNELFNVRTRCEGSFSSVQEGPPVLKINNNWSASEYNKKIRILWGYGCTGQGLDDYYVATGQKIGGERPRAPSGYDCRGGYYRVYNLSQQGCSIPNAKYTGQVFDPQQIEIINPNTPAWAISCAPDFNEQLGKVTYSEDACSVFGEGHPIIREIESRQARLASRQVSIPRPMDCSSGNCTTKPEFKVSIVNQNSTPGVSGGGGVRAYSYFPACEVLTERINRETNGGVDRVCEEISSRVYVDPAIRQAAVRACELEDRISTRCVERVGINSPWRIFAGYCSWVANTANNILEGRIDCNPGGA